MTISIRKNPFWFWLVVILSCIIMANVRAEGRFVSTKDYGSLYIYGRASILEHGSLSKDKPTLFFFGGAGERASCLKTYNLLKNVNLSSCNFICVAVNKDTEQQTFGAWKEVASGLLEYITDRAREGKINPSILYFDGYSNGGAGAYYSAMKVHGNTVVNDQGYYQLIVAKRLTLIEGTLIGVFKAGVVDDILQAGIPLNLYVSKTCNYRISENGRNILKEYKGKRNFEGMLVNYGHGNRIVSMVYEYPYNSHKYDF